MSTADFSGASFSGLDEERRAELWAALALQSLKGLKVAARAALAAHYGSPYAAVQKAKDWPALGLSPELSERYARGLWRDEARAKWDLIRASGEKLLLFSDSAYPALLREIPDPPLFIFYRGDTSLLRNPAVGVVGARKCTREGMSVAVNIARGLSRAGVTTISGLAKGIDRVVHLAGLEGPGGSIAVLGCGVDVVYPKSNLDLYDLMQEKGLIISEFLPGSEPKQYNFPVRNRIISGLSRAVLVVEAAVRSGTLITARHAAEQGREVYAVPGSATAESSEGCHDLIRRGAKPVFSAEDILLDLAPILQGELEDRALAARGRAAKAAASLDELGILPWSGEAPPAGAEAADLPSSPDKLPVRLDAAALSHLAKGLDALEHSILKLLNESPNCHIDSICNLLSLDAAEAGRALALLEVRGLVRRRPGMYYSILP